MNSVFHKPLKELKNKTATNDPRITVNNQLHYLKGSVHSPNVYSNFYW